MALVLITFVFALILIAATEVMFRIGRAVRGRYDKTSRDALTTVAAATLGMLALMIGFTMSMAESRFNARRQINIAEAAAVQTTYLRADLLPDPERSRTRELLRAYVAERRAFFRASGDELAAETTRSRAIALQVWADAVAVARVHPDWDVLASYLESLNTMIELEAARAIAVTTRLPGIVHIVLVLLAIAAIGVTGLMTGVAGGRSAFPLYVIPFLIALACMVAIDLDRARFGLITTGDRPMERVQRDISGVVNHPTNLQIGGDQLP